MAKKGRLIAATLFLILIGAGVFQLGRIRRPNQEPEWLKDLPKVANFALLDHTGRPFELFREADARAIVLISHANGCPVIRKLSPAILKLKSEFEAAGVRFYLINANLSDTPKKILEETKKFGFKMPVLIDQAQTVLPELHVERTGEALLIDTKSWKIVYRGGIDDRFHYNADKLDSTKQPLKTALQQFLRGDQVNVPKVDSVGCAIFFNEVSENISFSEVAPILEKKCVVCHQPGKYPPENMMNHSDWVGWSTMSKELIRTKKMPPSAVDWQSGQNVDEIILSPAEEKKLITWFDRGAPLGTARSDKLNLPDTKNRNTKKQTNMSLKLKPIPVLPDQNGSTLVFQQLKGPMEDDLWINEIQLNISPVAALHHADLLILPELVPDLDVKENRRMLRQPWTKENERVITLPRKAFRPYRLPKPLALKIPKGSYLAMEIHPAPTGKHENLEIEVRFSSLNKSEIKKAISVQVGRLNNQDVKVPANSREYSTFQSVTVKEPIKIIAVNLHSHNRGRFLRMAVREPGKDWRDVLSLPWYNPLLQGKFSFKKMLALNAGSEIGIECNYDNTAQNPFNPNPNIDVPYGSNIFDEEMCRLDYQYIFQTKGAF